MKKFDKSVRAALLVLAASLISTSTVSAHCRLDTPNGGEVLRIGSSVAIAWTELVPHGVQNWDLYYSTNGDAGPWIPIALDLPPGTRAHVWDARISPVALASQVRIRVVQDMLSLTYEDISDADLTILPSLAVDSPTISLAAGGAQSLQIDAGPAHAGQVYLILGSVTGTSPGQTLGGAFLPLNADPYFFATITGVNAPPFSATFGVLDANGRATGQFRLPPGISPALVGVRLHHAALVLTPVPTVAMTTNAVALTFGS